MHNIGVLVALVITGAAQDRQDIPPRVERKPTYWEWTGWKWTVEDSRIKRDRDEANKLINARQVNGVVNLAKLRRKDFESVAKPDALTLASWANLARAAAANDPSTAKSTGLSKSQWYLERVAPVASYEYARSRFLAVSDIETAKYLNLAERLLSRQPKDYVVKYTYVQHLITHNNGKARKLGEELIREFPSEVSSLALLGSCYYVPALSSGSREDYLKARSYYSDYIRRAGLTGGFVPIAKMRLENIKKRIG